MLTEEELQRYHRQVMIDGWDVPGQEKLKQSKVFVAGAGGLGSAAILYLASAGVGTLTICDCGTVGPSNLNRQILHTHERLGFSKVESAARALESTNPDTGVVGFNEKLDRSNAQRLIGDSQLILDCLDNWETRFALNEAAVAMRIPMIHAGVAGFRGHITFLDPPRTPCLACFQPSRPPGPVIPIAGCTCGVLGSMQAMEALKFLTGIGRPLKNELLFFDGAGMKFETMELGKNPDCPVCGR